MYFDLRRTKQYPGGEKSPDLGDKKFRDAIATLAAPIHGIPKDQLESDALRFEKRTRFLRRTAISGFVVLTVAAVVAGLLALQARDRAVLAEADATRQRDEAISVELAGSYGLVLEHEPEVAASLAIEAARVNGTPAAAGALQGVIASPWRGTLDHDSSVVSAQFNADRTRIITASLEDSARVWEWIETEKWSWS